MNSHQALRIGVSLGALAIASVHLWKPDLQIDSITVVLVVISVLPWAQPLIKSIKLFGVELELQEVQNRLTEVEKGNKTAILEATLARVESRSPLPVAETSRSAGETADAEMLRLAEEYESIRRTLGSGAERTSAMSAVVRQMIELAPQVHSFDLIEALRDKRGGRRLAAYAYVYARRDRNLLAPLVESLVKRENQPFGQYWGLQSTARVLAQYGQEEVPTAIVDQLKALAERIPRGTDRDYQLKRIIRDIDHAAVN